MHLYLCGAPYQTIFFSVLCWDSRSPASGRAVPSPARRVTGSRRNSKPHEIGGIPYYDGALGDPVPIDKAFELGCDKVVLLLTKPETVLRTSKQDERFAAGIQKKYPLAAKKQRQRARRYNEEVALAGTSGLAKSTLIMLQFERIKLGPEPRLPLLPVLLALLFPLPAHPLSGELLHLLCQFLRFFHLQGNGGGVPT